MPSKIKDREVPGAPQTPPLQDRERMPIVNALHVECIRAALARNEYVIDGRRIADRLLAFERQLAAHRARPDICHTDRHAT